MSTTLTLVAEAKIADLLPARSGSRWEASGVAYAADRAIVVFDDRPVVAVIPVSPEGHFETGRLIDLQGEPRGFEDVWFHGDDRRFYLLIEAAEASKGVWKPKVEAYDEHGALVETHWLDFEVESPNKGFEGIVVARRAGVEYLLGLCEGNRCRGGRAGETPGGGRIQVFRREGSAWVHRGAIKVPAAVAFADYASLALHDRTLAVLSQTSAQLWVGRLKENLTEFEDDGRIFDFPRNEKGKRVYCTLEGMAWLGEGRLLVVSDRMKSGEMKKRCAAKDQSIHLFRVSS